MSWNDFIILAYGLPLTVGLPSCSRIPEMVYVVLADCITLKVSEPFFFSCTDVCVVAGCLHGCYVVCVNFFCLRGFSHASVGYKVMSLGSLRLPRGNVNFQLLTKQKSSYR